MSTDPTPNPDGAVRLVPLTDAELRALMVTLSRLIAAGGQVDDMRALVALHDSLQARVLVFNKARESAVVAYQEAANKARQEGKEHPDWDGEFAFNRIMTLLINQWCSKADFDDHTVWLG